MDVNIIRAKVVAHALRLYARTGLQANRAYTPSAMLRTASDITGQQFKRGQYTQAAAALDTWVDREVSEAAGDAYLAAQHQSWDAADSSPY